MSTYKVVLFEIQKCGHVSCAHKPYLLIHTWSQLLVQLFDYWKICLSIYVSQHEKAGLMYTKYCKYLPNCIIYLQSVSCMRFLINGCISGEKFIRLLCLHEKLFNFEIQKCGQILCAHKTIIYSWFTFTVQSPFL